ncbi:hypothetical protein EfmAA96_06190 [Enterococcus faecium]|nr:hypothetical protein EfmAA96_06190 [Enterococcus faecium]
MNALQFHRKKLLFINHLKKTVTRPYSSEPKTDLFFGATNNGRKERAESYKQEFIKRDVTTNYFILPHRGNEQPGYLTYEEYLKKQGNRAGFWNCCGRVSKAGLHLN